ncbi:MAG: hypothetical protein WD690_01465 [Vicinamibacterales bacterium]
MKRSLRDPIARRSILERLARLTPDHPRKWGRMEPSQLLPHLASALRTAVGDQQIDAITHRRKGGNVFRYLAIHCLPWPKGRIQAPPGAFSTPSLGWERDREVLVELIERFGTAPPETLGPAHSMLGPMRPHDWDVLQYRHLDHHLRQFGV